MAGPNGHKGRFEMMGARLRMTRTGVPGPEIPIIRWAEMLTEKLGEPVHRNSVSAWESGKRQPAASVIKAYADLGNVSPDWLLADRDIPGYYNPWPATVITQLALSA